MSAWLRDAAGEAATHGKDPGPARNVERRPDLGSHMGAQPGSCLPPGVIATGAEKSLFATTNDHIATSESLSYRESRSLWRQIYPPRDSSRLGSGRSIIVDIDPGIYTVAV